MKELAGWRGGEVTLERIQLTALFLHTVPKDVCPPALLFHQV